MTERSSFCGPHGLLQEKVLVGTVRTVVWACVFHMCESLKFEGRSMVAMVPR